MGILGDDEVSHGQASKMMRHLLGKHRKLKTVTEPAISAL